MSRQPPFPSLSEVVTSQDSSSDGPLATALSLLFEPSPTLFRDLVPPVYALVRLHETLITYNGIIDLTVERLLASPSSLQAEFVGGHPRIGEVNGLSALSASEQAARATPPEVLERLALLNSAYESKFEGLRYITFVNGRSRQEVMVEMEDALGVGKGEVKAGDLGKVDVGGIQWRNEAERAVLDVGRIAKSRLKALGVDGDAAYVPEA
ncbi:hypothetical protein BV25DRAFT_1174456 [Artomyces pyxidatus]|uniref:Uncharacterized protein n=1 Tax=Artomyces pyxidatus TaxID=48021 RepID=A0ACB8SRG1_9AGAM|nr:hypothetical protein BV25DRAFT_1174456 [Artomyces pyxidatus]